MAVPTDQFSAIYDKAIKKYHEITGETLVVDSIAKIRNVGDLTREIDERNSAFREFRDKRGAIFNALETALIPVQLFGDLAAGGASMAFPPSSLVFGAVMHLVGAAKGVSASYDAIQDLMQTLQDFTIRLKTYTQEAISEALSDKLSDITVTLIEILALSSKTIRRGRLLQFTRNMVLGNNDAIQAAMARLDKLTAVEASLVGAETLTESKRAGRVVDDISVTVNYTSATVLETGMTVNQISEQVHGMQETLKELVITAKEGKQVPHEDQEALQTCVNQVVSPSEVDLAGDWFYKLDKARVPGTGDWLRGEDVFQSWIDKETPVIFLSGNPGAGKSFLAANMISFLLDKVGMNPSVSVGYFFFKGDNPQTKSFHQALRDVAFQLSKNDLKYRKYLATIERYEKVSTLESAWRVLFAEYFLKNPDTEITTYIVLDAVDETPDEERRVFIDLAKELYNSQSCLQLALVGRPYISDQLLEGLEVKMPTIHVTKQKNTGDIIQYIHASVRKSLVLRKVSAKLRDEIIAKLSAKAEGMFLWVNLMLQELVKKRNETSMRKALEQAPRGLHEMLRHVLATFSESDNEEELEYLNETLLWVTCADQPWRLCEIEAILRLKSPEADGMIDLEGALRRQWASFFTLHREDGLTTADLENGPAHLDAFDWLAEQPKKDELESFEEYFTVFNSNPKTTTVTFCHASIGDFLRDKSEGKVSTTGRHIAVGVNYNEARAQIFKTYLLLITDPSFAAKANDSGYMLQHAARHWSGHLLSILPAECSLDDRREISSMLLTVFRSEESMSSWVDGNNLVLRSAIIEAIQPWWKEQEIREALSAEEKDLISTINDDPFALFRPMVIFCVKKWLLEDLARPVPMVSMVWRYQMLLKDEEVDDYERAMTAEEIIEAAEFGGFHKTGRWFRQCATALSQSWHHEEASEYFERALELIPDDWRTLRELADRCQDREDWQAAIELWERTRLSLLATIKESSEDTIMKGHLHECLEHMAQIYQAQENGPKRFQAVQEACQYAPSCWTCIAALLEYHNDNHDYNATMDVLKQLADTLYPEEDCSELTQFFLANVFDVHLKSTLAADAASATDDLHFVLENLQTAARAARAASRTLIAVEVDMATARVYDEYLLDHQKAIRCWEKVMDTYSSSSDGTLIGIIRHLASTNLAQAFLCDAIEAGIDTPGAAESLVKLEKLVDRSQSYTSGSYALVPAVYLGMFCQLRGQIDRARSLFRASLQHSVLALRNSNPTADELTDLQYTLIRAGDMKNVVAIAHRVDESNVDDPWYVCRGSCRHKIPTKDGFSICSICLEGKWCPDCVQLKEAAMPRKRCQSQHGKYWICIPPQPKDVSSGMMLVDGEELGFDAWLNQLKKEWALDTSKPSDSTAGQLGFGDFLLGVVA